MISFFLKKNRNKNSIIIYLRLSIFFVGIINILSQECDRNSPIRKNGGCIAGPCTNEEYVSNTCYIDNSVIMAQRFNNIIEISKLGFKYVDIVTTSNGDLIIIASTGSTDEPNKYKRNIYKLKNDGHRYYVGNYTTEDNFYEINAGTIREFGNIFSIKFKDSTNNQEYIMGISSYGFEIYNLEKGTIFEESILQAFDIISIFQNKGSFIKLENNNYLLGILGTKSNNTRSFYLITISINSLNNKEITIKSSKACGTAKSVSCYETESKKIVCFYNSENNCYNFIAFSQDLVLLKDEVIATGPSSNNIDNYFECVHFTGEAGAFGYFDDEVHLHIQFKNLTEDNSIENYFSSINQMNITNKAFYKTSEKNIILKLSDSKICYIAFYNNLKDMSIIIIIPYKEGKVAVNYFTIHLYQLYNFAFDTIVRATLYNDFIALTSSYLDDSSTYQQPFLIIFGYANSIDFNVDISQNLETLTNVEIDLNSKEHIDNNVFGYIFNGTKIIEYSKGLKLKSSSGNEIKKGDILSKNETLILVLDREVNILEDSKIVYAMIVILPPYEIYNQFRESHLYDFWNGYYDEDLYFESQRKPLIGRHSYCNIIINEEIILKTDCNDNNCERCLNNEERTCINCRYSYKIVENQKICLEELDAIGNIIPDITSKILPIIIPPNLPSITLPETTTPDITSKILPEITTPNLPSTTLPETITPDITSKTLPEITTPNLPSTTLPETTIPDLPPTTLSETTIPNLPPTTLSETTIPNLPPTIEIENTNPDINIEASIFESTNSDTISQVSNKEIEDTKNIVADSNVITNITCSNLEIKNNQCKKGKITLNQINDIKSELLNSNNIKNNTNTIIKTENVILQISNTEEQKNSNIPDVSSIDLGKCEDLLKQKFNISEPLIIFKTDIKSEDLSSTYVQYEVYNPTNLDKLELDVCENEDITINVPVNLNSSIQTMFESLSQSGYNLLNENDSFYQDICSTYTTVNGTDITLSDRKKDIYTTGQSLSMCQTGCVIKSYNTETRKANCECSVTQNEVNELNIEKLFDKKEISKNFYKTLANSNFQVLKCFKLIIDLDIIKKNIGEIIMTILLLILFILLGLSWKNHHNQIQTFISSAIHSHAFNISEEKVGDNKNQNQVIRRKSQNKNTINPKKSKVSNNFQKIEQSYSIKRRKKSLSLKPRKSHNIKLNNSLKPDNNKIKRKHSSKNKILHNPPKYRNNKKSKSIKSGCFSRSTLRKKSTSIKNARNDNSSINNIYKVKNSTEREINSYQYIKKIKEKEKLNKEFKPDIRRSTKKQSSFQKIIVDDKKNFLTKSFNAQELNSLSYDMALKYDNRTYCQYYWSLLKKKQLILFAFSITNDYNLNTIKISLFIISFSLYFTINGFFFTDDTMHKVYEDKGKFNLFYHLPQILYSTLISSLINIILKILSLSEKDIISIKEQNDIAKAREKAKKIELCIKIKFSIFFVLAILFMIFFWYFISCFCAVYKNTQIILIKDTLISFGLSMIYPFGLNLLPGFFRIPALRAANKDKETLYKFSLILALI